ncbi:MAG: DUF1592 domain-containing protein [Verrucomicrobiaceae bacterium]
MLRVLLLISLFLPSLSLAAPDGAAIYKQHCASCHGDSGEGVADEYDEALVGKRSLESLTKYIHKSMPEDDEDLVIDGDAQAVAAYIHAAFYSPEAQAKLKPVRRDLLRLTQHQHRRSITDIVQSFRNRPYQGDKHGLRGNYFNKEKMNDRKGKLLERVDPVPAFDISENHGVEGINPKAHSIYWTGSLLPPETGTYLFRMTSPNGMRMYLNEHDHKEDPFIDGWVSSGNQMRSLEASMFLLGGHGIPIFIEFLCFKEEKSSLRIEWKPPHGVWEPIPSRVLYADGADQAALISTPFPPDDASLGYERGSSISKAWQESVANAAIEATSHIFGDIDQLARTKPDDKDRWDKLKKFCHQFAEQAFRRPPTPEQHQLYVDTPFKEAGDDADTATKRSLMLILTSPYFLYPDLNRNEQGQPDQFTTAAHLALSLWDSVPDKQLLEAAAKGHLSDDKQIQDQLWRMLGDTRARSKMKNFFYQWLNLAEKDDLSKDPQAFPGFDQALIADLRSSLDLFIDSVVWTDQSDYRLLFTTENVFLNQRLANFYGAPHPGGNEFLPLPTPDRKRAGIFTHPYVLAAFSYHRQTSPIHRGVYLSRNVLGRFLKPPPNAIEFKDADFDPTLTMREKVTEITKDQACMACHSIINPIGFSLEYYDAVGRFRTSDNNKPIDATSDYETPESEKIRITGPRDLAKIAVESEDAHRAFLKHLFHHLIQQPTNAFGFSKMDQLHETFQNTNFHIRNIIVTITKSTLPQPAQ